MVGVISGVFVFEVFVCEVFDVIGDVGYCDVEEVKMVEEDFMFLFFKEFC